LTGMGASEFEFPAGSQNALSIEEDINRCRLPKKPRNQRGGNQ
jgi:hypothetical protein